MIFIGTQSRQGVSLPIHPDQIDTQLPLKAIYTFFGLNNMDYSATYVGDVVSPDPLVGFQK